MEEDEEMKEELVEKRRLLKALDTKRPISTTDCPISITKRPKCSTCKPSLEDMIKSMKEEASFTFRQSFYRIKSLRLL